MLISKQFFPDFTQNSSRWRRNYWLQNQNSAWLGQKMWLISLYNSQNFTKNLPRMTSKQGLSIEEFFLCNSRFESYKH